MLPQEGEYIMEIQILNWLQSLHTPILDKIMQLITHLGDMGIIWIILTIVMLLIPKTRKSGVIMAAALIVDVILCNVILKNLISRSYGKVFSVPGHGLLQTVSPSIPFEDV